MIKISQGNAVTQTVLAGLTMHHPLTSFLYCTFAKHQKSQLAVDKVVANIQWGLFLLDHCVQHVPWITTFWCFLQFLKTTFGRWFLEAKYHSCHPNNSVKTPKVKGLNVPTFIHRHRHLQGNPNSSGVQFKVAYWPAIAIGGVAQLRQPIARTDLGPAVCS